MDEAGPALGTLSEPRTVAGIADLGFPLGKVGRWGQPFAGSWEGPAGNHMMGGLLPQGSMAESLRQKVRNS